MSREQVEKLIKVAAEPPRHGKWSQFCLEERVTKDEVFHWRKKLGAPDALHYFGQTRPQQVEQ